MSIAIYCNDCEQFVSLDPQGNCGFCGSHAVGVVDLLQGVTPAEARQGSGQKQQFDMNQSER
jgi:hypothetical protein